MSIASLPRPASPPRMRTVTFSPRCGLPDSPGNPRGPCEPDGAGHRQLDLPAPAASGDLPAQADDVRLLARLLAEPAHRDVAVARRRHGTNGQSLTDGVVVDLSRNMNRILEIDVEQRWVRVQAGVVRISSTRR